MKPIILIALGHFFPTKITIINVSKWPMKEYTFMSESEVIIRAIKSIIRILRTVM